MTFYRKQSIIFSLFAIPQTILYVMFFIAPIIGGIIYSFTDYNGINKKLNFVGIANYKTVFANSRFVKAVVFNMKYSALLVILILSLSLVLALILNSKIKGKTFFRSMFFFPAVLPLLTMTQGGPAGATESMAMLIYNHGFVERRLSVAMAEALVLAVIVCIVSFIQIVWSNKKRIY